MSHVMCHMQLFYDFFFLQSGQPFREAIQGPNWGMGARVDPTGGTHRGGVRVVAFKKNPQYLIVNNVLDFVFD